MMFQGIIYCIIELYHIFPVIVLVFDFILYFKIENKIQNCKDITRCVKSLDM